MGPTSCSCCWWCSELLSTWLISRNHLFQLFPCSRASRCQACVHGSQHKTSMLPEESWDSNINKAPEQAGAPQPNPALPFLCSPLAHPSGWCITILNTSPTKGLQSPSSVTAGLHFTGGAGLCQQGRGCKSIPQPFSFSAPGEEKLRHHLIT